MKSVFNFYCVYKYITEFTHALYLRVSCTIVIKVKL